MICQHSLPFGGCLDRHEERRVLVLQPQTQRLPLGGSGRGCRLLLGRGWAGRGDQRDLVLQSPEPHHDAGLSRHLLRQAAVTALGETDLLHTAVIYRSKLLIDVQSKPINTSDNLDTYALIEKCTLNARLYIEMGTYIFITSND